MTELQPRLRSALCATLVSAVGCAINSMLDSAVESTIESALDCAVGSIADSCVRLTAGFHLGSPIRNTNVAPMRGGVSCWASV